jgi:SNF2 family DNA or RNA helicase
MSKLSQALYPYQREDVKFMLEHPRCIDGNVMGLGKTIETLAVLEQLNPKHTLIVCKHAYLNEWFNQVSDWLGKDCLTPWDGAGDKLDGLNLAGPPFVCVNYDLLAIRKYWLQLYKIPWDVIVFDEAHKIKNHKAQRTKNAYLMKYERLYHLTGTPIQNSPADLFPLFHMIKPRDYSNYNAWVNTFCVMDEKEIWMKGPNGRPISRIVRNIVPGQRNHTEELNALLHMYMCRHEKSEVMPNLPPKQYRTIPVELGKEKAQYMTMQDQLFAMLDSGETISSPNVMAQMIRLRQICCDANLLSHETPKISTPSNKTQALLDLLEDVTDKVIVFSFFEQYISMISRVLNERKIKHVTITGKKTPQENSTNEQTFQNDESVRVCLGTIHSMGECWTLTEAKVVIFLDRFWNPAINEQCEDRAYGRANKGLEQSESTLIIDLFNVGTVEEHVHAVVAQKTEMINEIVVAKRVVEAMRKAKS